MSMRIAWDSRSPATYPPLHFLKLCLKMEEQHTHTCTSDSYTINTQTYTWTGTGCVWTATYSPSSSSVPLSRSCPPIKPLDVTTSHRAGRRKHLHVTAPGGDSCSECEVSSGLPLFADFNLRSPALWSPSFIELQLI